MQFPTRLHLFLYYVRFNENFLLKDIKNINIKYKKIQNVIVGILVLNKNGALRKIVNLCTCV